MLPFITKCDDFRNDSKEYGDLLEFTWLYSTGGGAGNFK